ncbi:hypothetical protein D3C81_1211980 [compost metagenome]
MFLRNCCLRGATRRFQDVITRIGALQAETAGRHQFSGTRILVGKAAAAAHHADHILVQHAVRRRADGGGSRAVIRLVDAIEAHVQDARRDVGRGRARISPEHVVTRIATTQRHIRHVHGLARSCFLVAKRGIARHRQDVALDAVVTKRHLRARRAVVGLVDAVKTHVQGARRDIGRGAARISIEHIVARIGARQVARRHLIIDHFASTRIFVAETALQAGHADLVARHEAFEIAIQGRLQAAVVDAVLRARDAIVQDARRDGRRTVRRRRGQAVVAQLIAAQGQAAGVHGLAAAHILVEESGAATDADVVARHQIAQHVAGAVVAQSPVIDLAIAADAHRQRARRDGKGRRAAEGDVVFGRP